jgi:hypothetical protein
MSQIDLVSMLDKKYSGLNGVMCPNHGRPANLPQSKRVTEDHGRMAVHGSGLHLICGVCGATQAVGAP